MTPEFWQRVASLFVAATDLAPADWPAFLERRECHGDASLFAQVIELFDATAGIRSGGVPGQAQVAGPDQPPEKVEPGVESRGARPDQHQSCPEPSNQADLQTTDFEGLLRQRMHVKQLDSLFFGSSALLVKNVGDSTYNDLGNSEILCAQFAVVLAGGGAGRLLEYSRSRREPDAQDPASL